MFHLWESKFWWFAVLFHLGIVTTAVTIGFPFGSVFLWTTVSLAIAYGIAESDARGEMTLLQGKGARRDTDPRRFKQSLIGATVLWFLVNGMFTGALYLFFRGELVISAISLSGSFRV